MKQKFVIKALVATLMLLSLALCSETLFAGNKDDRTNLWQKVTESKIRTKGRRGLFPKNYETFSLNQKLLAECDDRDAA